MFPCFEDEALLSTGECKPTDDLAATDTVVQEWNCAVDGNAICGAPALAYTGGHAEQAGVFGAVFLLTGALLCAIKRLGR